MSKSVFIYSSWRTASTWIWKKFRDLPDAHAYCEVYHEELVSADMATITKLGPRNWKTSRHPDSAPYFLEFTPLFTSGKPGIPGMTPDLVLEKMFPPDGETLGQSEVDYLRRLITMAEQGNKTPVLTCTRNLGRAPATRLSFPNDVHIVTVRNLWHQWMSFCNQHMEGNSYFLEQIDRILDVLPAGDTMLDHLRERFAPSQDIHSGEPPTERLLYAFVGLHLYSYARAFQAADVIVDINRLSLDARYCRDTENRIHELTGLPVDFGDVSCRIEYGPTPIPSLEELRANIESLMLVVLATTGVTTVHKVGCELRRIVDELYNESVKYEFYTRSMRIEQTRIVRNFDRTSAKQLADFNVREMALSLQLAQALDRELTLTEQIALLSDRKQAMTEQLARAGDRDQVMTEQLARAGVREQALIEQLARAGDREQVLTERLARVGAREQALIEQLARAGDRDQAMAEQLARATGREARLTEQRDILIGIQRFLSDRANKGPFRLRQLFRHPKSFLKESFGPSFAGSSFRAPYLRDGFIDDSRKVPLSLLWILRQPKKTLWLLFRQPSKLFRYIWRHPKKFLMARGCALSRADRGIMSGYIHKAPSLNGRELFDFRWYQGQCETKFNTSEDAYNDYLRNGWGRGKTPHPLFEVSWYLINNPEVAKEGTEPFTHYLNHGSREGRDPHPLFNLRWYLRENPQVLESNLEPLYYFTKKSQFTEPTGPGLRIQPESRK